MGLDTFFYRFCAIKTLDLTVAMRDSIEFQSERKTHVSSSGPDSYRGCIENIPWTLDGSLLMGLYTFFYRFRAIKTLDLTAAMKNNIEFESERKTHVSSSDPDSYRGCIENISYEISHDTLHPRLTLVPYSHRSLRFVVGIKGILVLKILTAKGQFIRS